MKVEENLQTIRKNIQQACKNAGRRENDVNIIAVTKYVSINRAKEAIDAGISCLGENRMEGFLAKHEAIGKEAEWHFIGSLQSRKVKEVIEDVDVIHSLDRRSLAKEIHKRATKPVSCFVQANVSGESSKHGVAKDEVVSFIEQMKDYPNIRVEGLMTMAPYTNDHEYLRSIFRTLRQLRDEVQQHHWAHAPCQELSMGMSNDYQIAVEEGATYIRIGSELVGPYEEQTS
ncbi:hypothetical protein J416_01209 [Gracilibacillus halophilus YIM-C55.5]|uniref:Pyridoxal phosphate homeostasis protein n=1 Tax=Gracilibacillus halophilus YIM-C55.5 TaxID=1308866 RepID=N4WVA7_9BACI|nr:YggS family pyridoxal phosphate-dependent enzyme [Gracilibacillus halophilus]ENH98315.1 hypothetical protein J416_01209 [Gracilibacillus halophilus YIM-C55.5]